MIGISEAINSLDRNGGRLNEGASSGEISSAVAYVHPFCLPPSLLSLYQSKNGGLYEDLVFSISNFLPIGEAVNKHRELIEMGRQFDVEWPPALFPIGEYNSAYLLVELDNPRKHFVGGRVFYIDIGSGSLDVEYEYDSLLNLILSASQQKAAENSTSPRYGSEETQCYNLVDRSLLPDAWF